MMTVTIKLPYLTSDANLALIAKYQQNQSNVTRFIYNRFVDNHNSIDNKIISIEQTKLTSFANSMNNIYIDSWFKQSAIYRAKAMYHRFPDGKIVFGSKKLFNDRQQNKLSKEDFKKQKLLPIMSIGEASKSANRKFKLDLANNQIIFKPDKKTKLELILPKLRKNLQKTLEQLEQFSKLCATSITYQLDQQHIYLTYDETDLINVAHKQKPNRFLAIDMNPNYVGYSVIDWKSESSFKLIDKGVISIKAINDKYFTLKKAKRKIRKDIPDGAIRKAFIEDKIIKITNKKNYEIIEIAKRLVTLASHYQVEELAIENLDIKPTDTKKGKRFNRLVNNCWNRKLLEEQLAKRCRLAKIKLKRINPAHSSQIGNLAYRQLQLPDMILASIEINRRAYICKLIDLVKSSSMEMKQKQEQVKLMQQDIFHPRSLLATALKSLEEFKQATAAELASWRQIYTMLKNSKVSYRVSLEAIVSKVFSLNNTKSVINIYSYL